MINATQTRLLFFVSWRRLADARSLADRLGRFGLITSLNASDAETVEPMPYGSWIRAGTFRVTFMNWQNQSIP
jgi:hypothetical protein